MGEADRASGLTPEEVRAKIARMPIIDKVATLSGYQGIWQGLSAIFRHGVYHQEPILAAECAPGDVDGMRFANGPRGVVLEGGATTFPVSVARGATWNPELERRIGDAIGKELRSLGGTLFGGVCVNLLRYPAWGRAQDTYGEDPVLAGEMGVGLVVGVQEHAMAAVKHFALHAPENCKMTADVRVSERALHEVFLPQFKQCVDAGVKAVGVAHNAVNGAPCSQNSPLLTDILRHRWGFDGFVMTDFVFGVRDPKAAIDAGLDLEMPYKMMWGLDLNRLIADGEVAESRIDESLSRLIIPQYKLPPDDEYAPQLVGDPDHQALAREAAVQSMVLLRNEGGLPLARSTSLAVLGRLAAIANLGDRGTSDTRPTSVTTLLDGLRSAADGDIAHFASMTDPGARQAVSTADAVVVVVGTTHEDEGEFLDRAALLPRLVAQLGPPAKLRSRFAHPAARRGWSMAFSVLGRMLGKLPATAVNRGSSPFGSGGDRTSLELSPEDQAMIRSACDANSRVIVVVMGSGPITMESWRSLPAAILMSWYPGAEGGHALADLVYGDRSPSGKLPFAIPTDARHLPIAESSATSLTYDLWHGYRKLQRDRAIAAFPFGFGLSYSSFVHRAMRCSSGSVRAGEVLTLEIDVENTGPVDADEVVQIYASVDESSFDRAPRELKAFGRVSVPAGETRTVTIRLPVDRLRVYDEALRDFVLEPATYRLAAARHVDDFVGPTAVVVARRLSG